MNCPLHHKPMSACQECLDEIYKKQGYRKVGGIDLYNAFRDEYDLLIQHVAVHINHKKKTITIEGTKSSPQD